MSLRVIENDNFVESERHSMGICCLKKTLLDLEKHILTYLHITCESSNLFNVDS